MYSVTSFYHFGELQHSALSDISRKIEEFATQNNLFGLLILGVEGVNATVSASAEVIADFKAKIREWSGFKDIIFKDSTCDKIPFRRFKVDLRPEIVTLGRTEIVPKDRHAHVSPAEWDKLLKMDDVVIIDVRNFYEVEVGKFRNAIDPKITNFGEFPEFVRKSGIPRDKRILMYCTGGIRCEKALLEMEAQGYRDVLQLDGGILNYFKEKNSVPSGGAAFEGECFVFDHRVALDHELEPTKKFGLCPHCGNPGTERIDCLVCGITGWVCVGCMQDSEKRTCSKAHRTQYLHRLKRPQKISAHP